VLIASRWGGLSVEVLRSAQDDSERRARWMLRSAGTTAQGCLCYWRAAPITSRTARRRAPRLKGLVRMRTAEPDWAASLAACSL
jgi:hypothetical protein